MTASPALNLDRSETSIVVTGLGAISPLGMDAHSMWRALREGSSGVGPLQRLPSQAYPMHFAAEADQFDGKIDCFGELSKDLFRVVRKGLKLMCREIQMGVASAQRALQDAGLRSETTVGPRQGVSFGSDYMMTQPSEFVDCVARCTPADEFQYQRWGNEGLPRVEPLWLLKYLPNMPASHIAIYNDFRGPSNSITMRESSSNLALGEGFEAIRRGKADVVVAGATGTRIHPLRSLHIVLQEQVAVGDDPLTLSRPFDRQRSGQVLGEGAGALILESQEHARQRGATPLARIRGHGSSAVVSPEGIARIDRSVANALRAALRSAGLAPKEIGHIHAHGLGAVRADALEAAAILDVFGPTPPPVIAAKSYFGNLGAGGGAVEAIVSILAMREQWLPPVLNYQTPDPDCAVADRAPGQNTAAGRTCANISFTPSGQAAVIILEIA